MAVPIAHLKYDQPALVTISPNATLQEAVAGFASYSGLTGITSEPVERTLVRAIYLMGLRK